MGRAHHPRAVGSVEIDRHPAEGPAPLDHARSSSGGARRRWPRRRQAPGPSRRRPRPGAAGSPTARWLWRVRRRKARWPMAKCGSMPSADQPRLLEPERVRWVSRSLSSVVHCCPVALTYCRSSSQMAAGGGRWSRLGVLRPAGRADEVRHGPGTLRGVSLPTRDVIDRLGGPRGAATVSDGGVEEEEARSWQTRKNECPKTSPATSSWIRPASTAMLAGRLLPRSSAKPPKTSFVKAQPVSSADRRQALAGLARLPHRVYRLPRRR